MPPPSQPAPISQENIRPQSLKPSRPAVATKVVLKPNPILAVKPVVVANPVLGAKPVVATPAMAVKPVLAKPAVPGKPVVHANPAVPARAAVLAKQVAVTKSTVPEPAMAANPAKNATVPPKPLCHAPRVLNSPHRVVATPPTLSKNLGTKTAVVPPTNPPKPATTNAKVNNLSVGHVSKTAGPPAPSPTAKVPMVGSTSNDWGARPAELADMDGEKWSASIADALFIWRPSPFPSYPHTKSNEDPQVHVSEPLIRESAVDPRYPPPATEAAILWSQAPEIQQESPLEEVVQQKDKSPESPFSAFVPSRDVLLEILHAEIAEYQPQFVCILSSRMVDAFSPIQLLDLLRHNPKKTRKSIESILASVIAHSSIGDRSSLHSETCTRCNHADANNPVRIKHSLRVPLINRVKTRHPFLAEDIVDTILEDVLIEVLNLLLHPFALLAEMIEIVDGCFGKLQARSRRKALREDMKVRISTLQPDKHAKVLAVVMREKDDTVLLDMLRYPKLLQDRVKQCLSIVRESEEATREKRIAKRYAQQLAAAQERDALKAKSLALAGNGVIGANGKKHLSAADIKSQMMSATMAQKMMLKPAVMKQGGVRTMALQKSAISAAAINRKPSAVKPVGAVANPQNLVNQQLLVGRQGAVVGNNAKRVINTAPNVSAAKKQKPAALVPPNMLGAANGNKRVLQAPVAALPNRAVRQAMALLPNSTKPAVAPPPVLVQSNVLAAHKATPQPLRVQQYVPSASPHRPAVSKPAAKRRKVVKAPLVAQKTPNSNMQVPPTNGVAIIGAPTTIANGRKQTQSVTK